MIEPTTSFVRVLCIMELEHKELIKNGWVLFYDNTRGKYYIDRKANIIKTYFKCIKKNSKTKILSKLDLFPLPTKKGYVLLNITSECGKKICFKVHRLVAEAFILNPDNKPQVNHKDGIKWNNLFENLEWNTISENVQHSYDTGLNVSRKGESHGRCILTETKVLAIRRLHKINPKISRTNLALKLGVAITTISHIINRRIWKHI